MTNISIQYSGIQIDFKDGTSLSYSIVLLLDIRLLPINIIDSTCFRVLNPWHYTRRYFCIVRTTPHLDQNCLSIHIMQMQSHINQISNTAYNLFSAYWRIASCEYYPCKPMK